MDGNSAFSSWVQEKSVVDGLISVYKPYGIPSTALVEMYKRASGLKVGHGGTLDPLARGAMLLGVGKGTKLLSKYLESEKRYRAEILLGAASSSGDLELPITVTGTSLQQEQVETVIVELEKPYMQELPALNAAKQQGKSAFQLVREGKIPEKRYVETRLIEWKLHSIKVLTSEGLEDILKEKLVLLKKSFNEFYALGDELGYRSRKYSFMLEKWEKSLTASLSEIEAHKANLYGYLDLEVFVPKGTYIRSLATDITSRLNTTGMLLGLERISAGNR